MFDKLIDELERSIFAAAYVKALDEDKLGAGSSYQKETASRAVAFAFDAVEAFREARKQRR